MRIRLHTSTRLGSLILLAAGLTLGSVSRTQDFVASSDVISGGSQLVVPLFKSRVLRLDTPAARISVGSPDIADILILRATQLYVLGQDLGTTNVLLWDSEDRLIGAVNVEVTHDLESLKEKLFELLPNEPIEVYAAQRSIVLAGEVSSIISMNAAMLIADTYLAQVATAVDAQQFEQESQSGGEDQTAGEIINLMQVGGVQQVILEIVIAEINRAELRRLNAQFNSFHLSGDWNYGGVNGGAHFPDADVGPVFGSIAPWGPAIDAFAPADMVIGNQGLFASFLDADSLFNLALDVAKTNGLSKILAEPTLTTLTGKQAYFNSGGQIAVRTSNGFGDVNTVFKDFGVSVRFTPIVLGSGLINLTIEAEVLEIVNRDPEALEFGQRKVSSTVELREGQTMALAGLIDSRLQSSIEKFPGLGSIPVLGALFRSQAYRAGETELVIMATPHLAKPIAPENIRLPTDGFVNPGDAEFYLLGRLEGRASGASPGRSAAGTSEATFGHQLD
ncbi:MAG: type II and III secretion system protein family protein [Gammaproteobacteria bacterium]|nr:MAG: type II and III secretion system protein family protein [Gammaproteobacteria bacterium]